MNSIAIAISPAAESIPPPPGHCEECGREVEYLLVSIRKPWRILLKGEIALYEKQEALSRGLGEEGEEGKEGEMIVPLFSMSYYASRIWTCRIHVRRCED